MKLTMLGTGNAMVTDCYNTCFLLEDEGRLLMVDGGGGNGVLGQLKRTGHSWEDVHHIFVTHRHIDHLLGIVWMMRVICQSMSRGSYEGEAFIYSHGEVLELLSDLASKLLLARDTCVLGDRLHLVEVHDGESRKVIGHKTTFFDIQSTKAKQFGFCMDIGGGRTLTCCGDEPLAEGLWDYARGADWMLHEAFCLYEQREVYRPYEKHHSTVRDACELAERLGVKNLVLYHTEDRTLANRKRLYRNEGKRYYRGNLFVPNDLESLEL